MKTHCDECNRNFKDEAGLAMHNSAKHNNTNISEPKQKSYILWFYLGLAVFVIAVIYFLYAQNSGVYIPNSNSGNSNSQNLQKVIIGMKDYNYYPNTITVKAGQPVEITLDSSVSDCYRSFNIPQFGVSQYSSSPGNTITFTPTEKGTFQFRCGMGMGKGTLVVE